jgi:hypothetical protein
MTVIGYARVSTTDQDLSIQESALRAAGCDVIRAEKQSGSSTQGRAELRTVLDFIGKGDVLLVTRVDRLARSIGDLQDIVRALKARSSRRRSSRSILVQRPGSAFSICWASSPSSKPTCGASASLRVSPKPRRQASTGVGSRRLIKPR